MEGGISRSLEALPLGYCIFHVLTPGTPGVPLVPGLPGRPRGPAMPAVVGQVSCFNRRLELRGTLTFQSPLAGRTLCTLRTRYGHTIFAIFSIHTILSITSW